MDVQTIEQSYCGFTIKVMVTRVAASFVVYDANGDKLTERDTMEKAIRYIEGRLEREAKKEDKPREKLDLAVLKRSRHGRKITSGTLTSVHGGTGNVIINGEQQDSFSDFYPDVVTVQLLIQDITKREEEVAALEDRLKQFAMKGNRARMSRSGDNALDLENALREEYAEKAALSS
jgi:hypothetical protein